MGLRRIPVFGRDDEADAAFANFAEEAEKLIAEAGRTGKVPESLMTEQDREAPLTAADRLAYYRAHGLGRCDDYPGGDKQFEADVLSGEQRFEGVTLGPLGREDAYIIDRMNDGRFKYDHRFTRFRIRPEVRVAFMQNAERNGFSVHMDYPYGSPLQYMKDVASGAYARRFLQERKI